MPKDVAPVEKSCGRVDWFTPPAVLDAVRAYSQSSTGNPHIELDPSGDPTNYTRATYFYDGSRVAMDGLRQSWKIDAGVVFCNPPYGSEMKLWCRKIGREAFDGRHIIALLPANRWETDYLQNDILTGRLSAMCVARKRLAFCGPDGKPRRRADGSRSQNPYGSCLFLFNGSRDVFASEVHEVGPVFSMVRII